MEFNSAIALERTGERTLEPDAGLSGPVPGGERDAPFFALAEALPAISFIHQDGRFRYVSRFGQEVLGYSQEQLLQMDYWELAHPDFRELIRSRGLRRQAGEELPVRYEFQIITGRGETRWLECVARRTEYAGRPAVLGAAFDITARREAQEALRLAEVKYRSIFENVAEGIFQVTTDGRVLHVNPALLRMLGYQTAEELLAAISDVTRQVIVLPRDRKQMWRLMESSGMVREFETQACRKDGSRIWVSVNAHVVRNADGRLLYYEGTATDITQRRRAEEHLRRREANHRALLDGMPDWMFRIRNDGTLLDCKVNEPDGLALAGPEARGRNLAEVWPAALVAQTMNHVNTAVGSGISQQFEFRHPGREGSRDYEARIVASGPDEALAIIRDLSEQTRLEQEVLTISGREQERIGKDLHDDVGQLLTGLGFLAQALQQKLSSRGLTEAADAGELNQLAARVLTRTRILARGLFPVELASRGLVVAFQELAANIGTLFKVACLLRWNSSLEVRDSTVAEHLYRMVQEAISNAIKHGRASRISIEFRASRGQPTLTVRDNGSGVSPLLEHLQGMGMRIMNYRARRIGATVDIRAAPRGGTIVTCRLPQSALHPSAGTIHEDREATGGSEK